jgi:alkylation response protein AidB-like acyl-CoA dehydrogenase
VPKENVLGEVGKGYKIAIETLNEGRIGIGAQMVGLAQGALRVRAGRTWPKSASSSATPSLSFQGVQFQLAEHGCMQIEASRLLTYNAARLRDTKLPASSRKRRWRSCSPPHRRIRGLEGGRDLYGGNGFTKELPGGEVLPRPEGRADLRRARISEATCRCQRKFGN